MNSNNLYKIREKISAGKIPVGTHTAIGEPIVVDVLCNCGFDLIWVDSEHSPVDKRDVNLQIITIRGSGVAPFVRVPWNDPVLVKPVLEMGPAGIVFPFIRTVEEAKQAVASCKYPPAGIRGFGPQKAINYGAIDTYTYLETAKTEPWVIMQIEHVDGVSNLAEIIRIPGVDSIVVGPNDLSGSIGLIGQTRHPEVLKLLDKIADTCNEIDFPFGTSIGWNEENVNDWIGRDVKWIVVDSDISYLLNGGKNTLNNVNIAISKIKG
jgi:2-keto-3-deoxy-L-rhamnonate aldolase RhmA